MKANSKVDLWIDTKVLARAKGKSAPEEEERIAINRYLELADLALNNDLQNKAKKVA